MHQHDIGNWRHAHDFARINEKGEARSKWVLWLTFLTMLAEIGAGLSFHSMALLADGWHMATHALAFMITIYAYRYGRVHAGDETFAFSPAKVGVLGGFASSIALAVVAVMMAAESSARLVLPEIIRFDEAIWVAGLGLAVNLMCALLLAGGEHHHHEHHHAHGGHDAHDHAEPHAHHEHTRDHGHHDHDHDHHEHHEHHDRNVHQDHNLRAAFLHVLADAFTSVLAIVALLAGKYYGWNWLDAVMGLVGAAVILLWARGLIKDTAPILLDQTAGPEFLQAVRGALEADGECMVSDLHVWRVSPRHYAAIVVLVTRFPQPPYHYRMKLAEFVHLDHVTIEVNQCAGEHCAPAPI